MGDGFKPGILKRKSMNAAAPNFVHALDASHLIRVVNAAASEGITPFSHTRVPWLVARFNQFERI